MIDRLSQRLTEEEAKALKTNRIDWTEEEIEKLGKAVAQLRMKNAADSILAVLLKAMEQLPKNRRRKITSHLQVPKVVNAANKELQKLFVAAEIGLKPPPPPPEPPPPPPAPPPPPTAEEIVRDWSTDKIALCLFSRVLTSIHSIEQRQGKIEDVLNRIMVTPADATQPASAKTEVAKAIVGIPRIVIVGLLGGQQQQIANAFGKKADLRFIGTDRKPSFPHVDHIILMTKFLNHTWEEAATSTVPRDRVHRVLGGLTELTNLINTLIPSKIGVK